MDRADLERRIGWQLHQLPAPGAPATLLPRVMAAVQAWATRPWYQRAWTTWPAGWQAAAFVVLTATAVGAWMLAPAIAGILQTWTTTAAKGAASYLPDIGPRLEVISLAAPVLWRALIYRVLFLAFVVVALMSLACATVAAVLNRAVFGRAIES